MDPFFFSRATTLDEGIAAANVDGATVIAGGTELVNWLKEGIAKPTRVVAIDRVPGLDRIALDRDGLHFGALARMSDVAEHPEVKNNFPAISEALLKSASPQLRKSL